MDRLSEGENRNNYLKILKKVEADTVFLAAGRDTVLFCDDSRRDGALRHISENIRFFAENHLNVGVWIQAFRFGDSLNNKCKAVMSGVTKIKSVCENESGDAFCPEDERFMVRYCRMIKDIAKTGTKMVMIDDDLCLSVRPGLGCFCDKHKRIISNAAGKALPQNNLLEMFFTGESNEWRSAWHKAMKETLVKFCKRVRKTVDEVDENIRMGFCAGFTSWDIECADALELTKILAGNTKPFLRLTGAPYWVAKDCNRFDKQRLHKAVMTKCKLYRIRLKLSLPMMFDIDGGSFTVGLA